MAHTNEEAATLQSTLEQHFTWFHEHPELANAEIETTAHIREALRGAGIDILDTGLATGLVAQVRGKAAGPVVALRGDIDALPITEASGLPYASRTPGLMHACGHDFHTTALLGAALLLSKEREALPGTVKLVFQPAEEGGGGAQQVLDTHVLDDVREIYGLHVAAEHAGGVIGVGPGATHAAVGAFKIVIRGKGGHGAYPHYARDPVAAAAHLVNAAHIIVSRNTNPFAQAVVSVTHVEAGNTWNVIPESALLEGTFRAFSDKRLAWIAKRLADVCRGTAKACGLAVDFTWRQCTLATYNDPALSRFAARTAQSLGFTVVPGRRGMGGEDFALYQKRVPGVFLTIGVNSPEAAHHPGFIADRAHLASASRLLAALGRASLARLADGA